MAQVFYRSVSLKRVAGHLQAKKGIRDTGLVTEQDYGIGQIAANKTTITSV